MNDFFDLKTLLDLANNTLAAMHQDQIESLKGANQSTGYDDISNLTVRGYDYVIYVFNAQ